MGHSLNASRDFKIMGAARPLKQNWKMKVSESQFLWPLTHYSSPAYKEVKETEGKMGTGERLWSSGKWAMNLSTPSMRQADALFQAWRELQDEPPREEFSGVWLTDKKSEGARS